jgi:exodeoxyribonuclease-3
MGIEDFDREGRIIRTDYPEFIFLNVYFPNGKASAERLQYKMDFYEAFFQYMQNLILEGKKVIVCGDVNTAHEEIDLARPKENENTSGFLKMEREWISRFIDMGMVDTFRFFNKEGGKYSWWDYKTRARERNVGWRIDYIFISENLRPFLKNAFILSEVKGSDHCPIGIELEI